MHLYLKNDLLTLEIEPPGRGYTFPRFDQTGKIVSVIFNGIQISGVEKTGASGKHGGLGLFNEFGIENPLGFEEAEIGDWSHKIGVGMVQKINPVYHFLEEYNVEPCDFDINQTENAIRMCCRPPEVNGYGYVLDKEITLTKSGFYIVYRLTNTGKKPIHTTEYGHNFLAINNQAIGRDYALGFPFDFKRLPAAENVNPEQKVVLGSDKITFKDNIQQEFFFSDLSGETSVAAQWELRDSKHGLFVRETGDFKTNRVNLWGNGHVVCPEMFVDIHVAPGETQQWQRSYVIGAQTD